ncbi:MAG: DUF2339 domain-containing protein [Planctomycetota bacterium]
MHSLELVIALFVLGIAGAIVIGVVLGVTAYWRVGELTRRIASLERALREKTAAPGADVRRVEHVEPELRARPATPAAQPWSAPRAPDAVIPPPPMPSPHIVTPPSATPAWSSSAPTSSSTPRPAEPIASEPPRTSATRHDAPAQSSRGGLERALGVTGAAVLGGIVLAIAGFYFYQYSVQQGLITPAVRIALGTALGVAAIGASEVLRRRNYRITSNSLAGGGVVVLYAAFWAAFAVFRLWPFWASFAAMGVVTAACAWLASSRPSQTIAVLGFVGGFATPIALSTGSDRPIGLFGWTLLVNLGFLSVAHKRRWPMIGILGLLGTTVIEGAWIFTRMGPRTFPIALVSLGVFALLFVGFVALQPSSERSRWRVSQIGAVFLPFVFGMYFAQSGEALIGDHLYPTALLAALLCAAASFVARERETAFVPIGAAAGSLAICFVWTVSRELDLARSWELVACAVGLAAVLHAGAWLRVIGAARTNATLADGGAAMRARGISASAWLEETWTPAIVAAGGLALVLMSAAARNASLACWPWVVGWTCTSLLLCRQGALAQWRVLPILAALSSGVGMWAWNHAAAFGPAAPSTAVLTAVLLGFVLLFQIVATRFVDERARRYAWWAAGISALFALAAVGDRFGTHERDPRVALFVLLAFGVCVAVAANQARASVLFALGVAATAMTQLETFDQVTAYATFARSAPIAPAVQRGMLLVLACTACAFTLAPFVRRCAWTSSRWVWRIAACASALWFIALRELWETCFTSRAVGVVPLVLAATAGAGVVLLGRATNPEDAVSEARLAPHALARVWFAAAALFWLSVALPLQLDRHWFPIGLALAAASFAWLQTKLDHRPLEFVASGMLVFASVALVATRLVGAHPVYPAKLVNWLAWQYLVPAAAAALAARWFARHVSNRVSPERARDFRWGATVSGLCAAGLFFAWLNLAILNGFDTEPKFAWLSERLPARDLTMSLAWALYALALLVVGVGKQIGAARWISLALFVLTIAKVFLFDLGNLQGLYRVTSLLGLAFALLIVSMLYQRFVFRSARSDAAVPPPDTGPA